MAPFPAFVRDPRHQAEALGQALGDVRPIAFEATGEVDATVAACRNRKRVQGYVITLNTFSVPAVWSQCRRLLVHRKRVQPYVISLNTFSVPTIWFQCRR